MSLKVHIKIEKSSLTSGNNQRFRKYILRKKCKAWKKPKKPINKTIWYDEPDTEKKKRITANTKKTKSNKLTIINWLAQVTGLSALYSGQLLV